MSPNLRPLANFLQRARAASLLVVADPDDEGDPPIIQRLNLHEDVATGFLEVARGATPDLGDVRLREYDPGYKPEPDELTYIPLAEVEGLSSLVRDLGHVDSAELFGEDDDLIKRLRFYAVVVGNPGGRAVFFRHYSPKKELGRHAAFALMFQKGTYDQVKEKIFLFDEAVDCFTWNGSLFIKNVTQFQRMFAYFEGLRAKARDTIEAVHARVPISNVGEFEEACMANSLMLTKLASIARRPYLNRVTFADVEKTIKTFGLEVQVVGGKGAKALVFDQSREGRWRILKLLDDDYLGSIMTEERYEVNSKIRRE
jgi:hypothetical protein